MPEEPFWPCVCQRCHLADFISDNRWLTFALLFLLRQPGEKFLHVTAVKCHLCYSGVKSLWQEPPLYLSINNVLSNVCPAKRLGTISAFASLCACVCACTRLREVPLIANMRTLTDLHGCVSAASRLRLGCSYVLMAAGR